VFSQPRPAGTPPLTWDGRVDGGAMAASGAYICRMRGALGDILYHSIAVVK
jgi:hypothetical protein